MPEATSNSDPRSQASFISGKEEAKCYSAFPEQISPCPVVDQFFDSGWHGVLLIGGALLISFLIESHQERNGGKNIFCGLKGVLKFGGKGYANNRSDVTVIPHIQVRGPDREELDNPFEFKDMTKASRKEVWSYLNWLE